MSWLIEQVFIALLSFSKSLATKCVSLNNEPSKNWPTLIDLNPVEFRYWPFMISLHKVVEVVILLITYLQKYVFRVKQKT